MNAPLHRLRDVVAGLDLEAEAFAAEDARALVWTSRTPALVCPASFRRKPGFEAAVHRSRARGWPVHQRPTGGGAVPQGPGVVNLALAFTTFGDFGIESGYRLITGVIRAALSPAGAELTVGATPGSFCDGNWNLSVRGQKLVGTAQRIRPLKGGSRRVLAHALILTEGDVGPGAKAVNRFHEALGPPPVVAAAHTTLRDAFTAEAFDAAAVAHKLRTCAADALAALNVKIAA